MVDEGEGNDCTNAAIMHDYRTLDGLYKLCKEALKWKRDWR